MSDLVKVSDESNKADIRWWNETMTELDYDMQYNRQRYCTFRETESAFCALIEHQQCWKKWDNCCISLEGSIKTSEALSTL